jgi:hypothetical protein
MASSSSDSLSPPRLPCVFESKTFCSRLPECCDFPGISAELVRKCEITGIFHRCKYFLIFFENFCKQAGWYGGNAKSLTTGDTDEHRNFLHLPVFAVHHALDAIAQVKDVEVNQQADAHAAEAHIGEKLSLVDRMNGIDRFYFYDDPTLDR